MNSKSSTSKNTIIIGIVLVVILGGVWYFYSRGGSSQSTSQVLSSSPNDNPALAAVGANVLATLNSVSSINIDASFFGVPAYQSLVDYSIAVPPQPIGRSNPFAPIGQ